MRPSFETRARCAMAALAHPGRLSIYRRIRDTPGICLFEFPELEVMSQSTLHYHLRELATAQLILGRGNGKTVQYYVIIGALAPIRELLTVLELGDAGPRV